jgi:hypothetical protein
MEATSGGTLMIDSPLANSNTVSASGGGTVTFDDVTVNNTGQIGASRPLEGTAGTINIDGSAINNVGGTISAVGSGDLVQFSGSTVNGGTLATGNAQSNVDGAIEFFGTNNALNGAGASSMSSISVPAYAASTEWHATGIDVTAGEQVTITARGTVVIGNDIVEGGQNVSNETPAGDPNIVTGDVANNFLENGLVPWSLIGIISSSVPSANAVSAFQVGNATTLIALASGELYLSINDNYFPDNSGTWSASVSVNSPGTVTNSGFTQLEPGANLALAGVIDNTGTFDVDPIINPTATNLVITGGVVLEGSGSVTLDGSTDNIVGATGGGILENAGNTISGAGNIGLAGNGLLSLINYGTVEATTGSLVVDTGQTVINNGTLEANGATLLVDDPVSGSSSGQLLITPGGTADFAAALGEAVDFTGATGTLVLNQPQNFTGQIEGFTGTAPNVAHSDVIDLAGYNSAYTTLHASFDSSNDTTTLSVADRHDDLSTTLTFDGRYSTSNFDTASDGSGGTDIFDPPATGSNAVPAPTGHGMSFAHDQFNLSENNGTGQNAQSSSTPSGSSQSGSVSIGGAVNDHFVFQPAQFTETNLNTNQPSTPSSEHADDHANTHLAALVAHEAVFQPAFDAVHDDAAAATAQFHQIVASAGHLH